MGKRNLLCSKISEEKEDRISKLSDNLVHQILSFIDVKYAVQTSVLSKRWKDVWVSLPFLNISSRTFRKDTDDLQDYEKRADRFINFVDTVLIFRDEYSDIQTFNLYWHDSSFKDTVTRNVTRWMLMAVKRNFQELCLEIGDYYDLAFELPHRLLNCESLRKLSIISAGVAEYREIVLPKSMCLPQLEALVLVQLSISSVKLENLIASCPLVKQLHIIKCDIQNCNQQGFVIDSPSLESFALTDTPRYAKLADCAVANVTKLSAPKPKFFVFKGFMTQVFCLKNLSSLDTVSVNMRLGENDTTKSYSTLLAEEKKVFAERMMKFLGALYNARILILSPGLLEVLSQALDLLNCQHLRFCNLRRMDLRMWFTRGSMRSLAYVLEMSPIVSHLFLTSEKARLAEVGDNWEVGLSLPCTLPHLKFVEIKEVEASDNELKFLSFLLKKGIVLELMDLLYRPIFGSVENQRRVKQFKKKLRALPRVSNSLTLF